MKTPTPRQLHLLRYDIHRQRLFVADEAIGTDESAAFRFEPEAAWGFGFPEALASLDASGADDDGEQWFIGAMW